MTRRADLSAEAQALYDELDAAGLEIPQRAGIERYRAVVRAGFETTIRAAVDSFDGVIESFEIAAVPCRQLTPAGWSSGQDPCIQYAYGGGFISGSTYEDQIIAIALAQRCNARVVMVEYRLSPEHPYPAAQQDMYAVYPDLLRAYGADRLVISGESAGGNLALGLLQQLRDSSLEMPRCTALFSPWCDLGNDGDSHLFNDGRDPSLSNAWVDMASALHADGTTLDDPGLSPLFGDMHGLPPTIITTGTRDLLLSQCLRLAQKLRAAGVPCDLRVWEGLWHVFEFYPVPEAAQSLHEVATFIRNHSPATMSRLTR